MRAKLGVIGAGVLILGAVAVSSVSSKTAEARSIGAERSAPQRVASASAPSATSASEVSANRARDVGLGAPRALVPAAAPVVAAPVPFSAATEIVLPPPADLRLEDPRLRRLRKAEITPAMLERAARIVKKHYAKPVGTRIEVEIEGRRVTARLERHFHPEGGPVKPWGFHPGVSLFIAR